MKRTAIFCDFDGTIVGNDLSVNPVVITAIKNFQAQGGAFVIATGRGMHGALDSIFKVIPLTSPQIIHGGAEIIDPQSLETVRRYPIPSDLAANLIAQLQSHSLYPEVCQGSEVYASLNQIIHRPGTDRFLPLEGLRINHISKIRVVVEHHKLEAAQEILSQLLGSMPEIIFHQSHTSRSFGFDITAADATKAHAVAVVQEMLGLTKGDSIAIGDGMNDLPLFTACGVQIAMGNSPQELKDAATMTVSDVAHNGVAEAIHHLLGG